jgi:hypothetical protein
MQGNEILAPTMANMRLQNLANNVNPVGGFGGVPGPVPFNASAAVPYNPEVRINHPVYPQMPTHSPMEIENTPSFPSFCADMTTPVSSAYITPTMRNSPPPPRVPQLQNAFSQLPRPTATIQPGHIVHFAHPSIPPPKQTNWACQFHLRDELHRQYIVLKCNNHNPAGLLGTEVNYYPEGMYLRGPHAQAHFMIDIKPALKAISKLSSNIGYVEYVHKILYLHLVRKCGEIE